MFEKGLAQFFEKIIKKESLFLNKKHLQTNYTPETIKHRDEQIKQIADVLVPSLKLEKCSNLFVYGKTGTGKTLTVRYVCNELSKAAVNQSIPLKIFYINCKLKKIADTEYRLLAQLSRELGKTVPSTGLPTDEVYKIFFDAIDNQKQYVILVLDEIDQLVKKVGDEILYNLTRANTELSQSQVSIIGISNDLIFLDNLDPRVRSSLGEEEIIFSPYNAFEIQDILKERVGLAFKKNVVEEGLVEKCAAYSAREHGDARRAIDLLRVAGEIAERKGKNKVGIEELDEAEEKIEKDRIIDIVITQPKQFQAVLYSILVISESVKTNIFTGDVYNFYKQVCAQTDLRPLTQRRVSDVIAEFDMLGVINTKIISKGRYGRSRDISLAVPSTTNPRIKKILEESLELQNESGNND